jgi:hypothetical protein
MNMLVQFSMIALGAQLVVMVADDVPRFDIARGCRVDSTQAFDLNTGQNETVKKCVSDEHGAMAVLSGQWSQFRETDRRQCMREADISRAPSYADLLTCLQLAKDARQLPK